MGASNFYCLCSSAKVAFKVPDAKPRLLVNKGASSDEEDDHEEPPEDDTFFETIEIDEADERALELFMSENSKARRTLADIIMEKLKEHETEVATFVIRRVLVRFGKSSTYHLVASAYSDAGSMQMADLDPKVVEMYRGVKKVLSRYRSGKLPKAFKIIPALSNWEQVLHLTDPDSWSSAAMYQATRIFASNLKEKMAQRFYNLVLLPRVRDDIAEYKKLNYHLYQALRKALFKPGAFFKGDHTSFVRVRNLHPTHAEDSRRCLTQARTPSFCALLIDKKYTLPYRVIDAVVHHFPQCLLSFCQRYKGDISSEQKEALLALLRAQSHYSITPEIRWELQHATCRDVEVTEPMPQEGEETAAAVASRGGSTEEEPLSEMAS
ncbi:hypothetical protein MRX96_033285 [Rhipicephalus microplus]